MWTRRACQRLILLGSSKVTVATIPGEVLPLRTHIFEEFRITDNPQVQGINVKPLNVEVLGIKLQEQQGKVIYSLKLECHNSSYLCTAQKKDTTEIDFIIVCNKVIK
jgi:hypothetical protein